MKYYLLIILLWILPKIGLAQEVISDEAVDELIGQAVFAEDPRESPIEPGGTRSIGMAVDTIGSLGVVYRWSASSTRVAWISGLYGPKIPIFVDSLDPALQNGALFVDQKYRLQLAAGVDQHLPFFGLKHWRFVVGLGAGINRTEFEATYYKKLCTFVCGFDPKSGLQRKERDINGFLQGRLGVVVTEKVIAGVRSEIGVYVNPILARWPKKYRFENPFKDHTNYSYAAEVPLYLETSFQLN